MKYDRVLIYTKKGNLMQYLNTGKVSRTFSNANADSLRQYYGQEREIQLIARIRWESNKCFCSIKCPINPLPVKGEFEVPSYSVVERYLRNNGWQFKQKIYPRMFE